MYRQWQAKMSEVDELRAQGRYGEALEQMPAVLELARQIEDDDGAARAVAISYGRSGEFCARLGDLQEAKKCFEIALGASLEARDGEGVVANVRNIYETAVASKDYPEMEKWSAIGARSSGQLGLVADSAEWELRLAEAQALQDRWTEAAPVLRRAVDRARAAIEDDPSRLSLLLNNAAELLRRHDVVAEARPLYEEAIQLRRTHGLQDVELGQFLHNLAFLYQESSDPEPAEALLEEALALFRAQLPPGASLTSQTLNNLGAYHHRRGNAEKARLYYDHALRSRMTHSSEAAPEHATLLDNWAGLELEVGNDPVAKGLLDRLDEASPVHDTDAAKHVHRMSRVASIYERLGRYDEAERLSQRIVAIVEREEGTQSANYARARGALANVLANFGQTAPAAQIFEDTIERMRALSDLDPEDLSTALNNFGLFCYERDDTARAEKLLDESLTRRRAALSPLDPALLDTMNNLGLVHIAQQRYEEAESILREVLGSRRRALIADHPNLAQSLFNLGMLYADMGRVEDALPLLQEQFEAEDRLLSNVFAVTSEGERLAYAAKLRANLDVLMMKMIGWSDRPQAVRIAFEAVLRRKGLVAETAAKERSTILGTEDPAGRKLMENLNAVRGRIARGILDGPSGDATVHQEELAQLNRKREQIESKLARTLAASSALTGARANCESVAAALPKGSALLEFLRVQLLARGVDEGQLPAAYAVFVIPAQQPERIALHFLGTAQQMESAVERLRAVITGATDRSRGGGVSIEQGDAAAVEQSIGQGLSAVLIDRVRPSLDGCQRLFIAPDGILNRLPFEILHLATGRRAGEEFEISYVSSGRDLLRIDATRERHSTRAVVVADPDFDLGPALADVSAAAAASPPSGADLHFTALADTKTEGQWVAAKLGAEYWEGAEALDSRVKCSQSPRVLHLATHGFFVSQPPGTWTDTAREASDSAAPAGASTHPLLCSGLALAGANRWLAGQPLPAEAEDGLLTAEDVCAMDLRGTELVVLSACETGLGEYRAGEGVFGLRRAFELAGAGSLVMSLWRVPSAATCEFMKEFYRHILQGRRRSQALREAQRIVRRRYPPTLYWGAFVLSGDSAPLA